LNEEVAAAAAAATAAGAGGGYDEGEATNDLATYSLPSNAAEAASRAVLATGVLPPTEGASRSGRRGGRRGGKAKLIIRG
jgi:hypothetical protein